ncbi:bifunctional folylpolyglutamate synthase/dihydrofolate synthase [Lactococcus termiticola]|uniref:tetrahydrofolate synthase n=1 Tax=Lactococcus termiticola TaxID=2169526 RepID=A0A2R5HK09_9LACT|nr:folylpolyglutamate synthase/dihydrofolate synthase family protein [Lactococcus termiticola]GBG97060.1 folylpolyglutamate synthase [Lactococcus termiticola]
MTRIDEALDWIHSRLKFNIRPGLSRVEALLDRLEHPDRSLSMIHVAGTNGKGSTVAFTASIFREAGLRVATFTSPFIVSFGERMSINSEPIPDERLITYVDLMKPMVEEMDSIDELAGVTEFEIITAMAFKYFADETVDLAIIEVGLGGLLDSTNVILPELTAITTIGLDHVDILGDSYEAIASQKAGIIKDKVPLVTGNIIPEAMAVIDETAKQHASRHYRYGQDYKLNYDGNPEERFDFEGQGMRLSGLVKGLQGKHQIENAGMAIEMSLIYARQKGIELSEDLISKAVAKAFWPGRMEEIAPSVFIDGAHNVHAIRRLIDNLETEFAGKKLRLLFSAITTKDIGQMLDLLKAVPGASLSLTTFDYPKALALEDFKGSGLTLVEDWYEEVDKEIQKDEILIVTGSLYFISQVRAYLLSKD